jgi:hypothetical protein
MIRLLHRPLHSICSELGIDPPDDDNISSESTDLEYDRPGLVRFYYEPQSQKNSEYQESEVSKVEFANVILYDHSRKT